MAGPKLHTAACLACVFALRAHAGGPDLGSAATEALRAQAAKAFAQGDYDAMAAAYAPLAERATARFERALLARPTAPPPPHAPTYAMRLATLLEDELLDDWEGLGHAHQLAGRWKEAASTYGNALRAVDKTVQAFVAEKDAAPYPPAVRHGWIDKRAFLIARIGRIQREGLKDLAASAATLAKTTAPCPALNRPIESLRRDLVEHIGRVLKDEKHRRKPSDRSYHYPLLTLRALAVTQERSGRVRAAIETRCRADLAARLYKGLSATADIKALADLLELLPPGQPLPDMPMLAILTPGAPKASLHLDSPETLARAFKTQGGGEARHWHFAFSPPPGKEFAALRLACDIEQFAARFGGHVRCSAKVGKAALGWLQLGTVSWHGQGAPGRGVVERRLEVPLGAKLVALDICQWKGKFKVHRVDVEAEFRVGEILPPQLKAKASIHVMPPGGVLTANGERIRAGVAYHGLEPGRYTLTYSVPGHKRTFRSEGNLAPGGYYNVFVNLDSPFEWALTNLRRIRGWAPRNCSLARLPDGRWLVAYTGVGPEVRLSTSRDGVTWEAPWPLPEGKLFKRFGPALHVDGKGTVWLACFCNRPHAGTREGFNLWLRSSRDGRTWSSPRPLSVEPTDRYRRRSLPQAQMAGIATSRQLSLVGGKGGRLWVFWGYHAACGDPAVQMGPLRKTSFDGGPLIRVAGSCVIADERGRFHCVFADYKRGICHSTSRDGLRWSAPTVLVATPEAREARTAQLILRGGRAALIYGAGRWRRGTLEPKPQFGPPVAIARHRLSRLHVMPDGHVTALAGDDTVWLIRAPADVLTRPEQTEF